MNGAQLFWAFTGKVATEASSQLFSGSSIQTFVVPDGVYSITMAGVSDGESSTLYVNVFGDAQTFDQYGYSGGNTTSTTNAGGNLAWRNNVSVTPGATLTIDPNDGSVKQGATVLLNPTDGTAPSDGHTLGGGGSSKQGPTISVYQSGALEGEIYRASGEDSGQWNGNGGGGFLSLVHTDSLWLGSAGQGVRLVSGGSSYGAGGATPDEKTTDTTYSQTYGIDYPVSTTHTRGGSGGAVRLIWPGVSISFPAAAS